jgi:N-acetylmuramoyl-L-alanine amidase
MVTTEFLSAFTERLTDIDAMWLTLYGEFRGEPVEAIVGGANVIMNRVGEGGKTIRGVCLKPSAFSCWNPKDPNLPAIINAYAGGRNEDLINVLRYIAERVMKSEFHDNTAGSNHYLTTALYRSADCPTWAKNKDAKYKTSIGRTTFIWCP